MAGKRWHAIYVKGDWLVKQLRVLGSFRWVYCGLGFKIGDIIVFNLTPNSFERINYFFSCC